MKQVTHKHRSGKTMYQGTGFLIALVLLILAIIFVVFYLFIKNPAH